jgi:hypothetical protein
MLLSVGCLGGVVKEFPNDKPPSDDRNTALGILCDAHLMLNGTFAPDAAMPKPAEVEGCWAVGIWTFSATVDMNNGCEAPKLEKEYKFQVTRDASDNENYTYLTDPANEFVRVKVTSGGSGLCEGGVTIFSTDGKTVWNLKPNLFADNTLGGQGEYEVYGSDQR